MDIVQSLMAQRHEWNEQTIPNYGTVQMFYPNMLLLRIMVQRKKMITARASFLLMIFHWTIWEEGSYPEPVELGSSRVICSTLKNGGWMTILSYAVTFQGQTRCETWARVGGGRSDPFLKVKAWFPKARPSNVGTKSNDLKESNLRWSGHDFQP